MLCGGDVLKGEGFDNGAWVAPTVFTDCTDEMTIVREEIFGPVMSILTYESIEEADSPRQRHRLRSGGRHRHDRPEPRPTAPFISSKRASAGSTPGANPPQRCRWAATNTPALAVRTAS